MQIYRKRRKFEACPHLMPALGVDQLLQSHPAFTNFLPAGDRNQCLAQAKHRPLSL